ncbi:hypothetical protein TNCV_2660161 [Trichonephila clavipes]|uniref:Uncharacterized protein n=1 Tax=Trichonephila clavipes TaxID=2585209 RepID=A0A8X6RDV7_TRICX|nr:hypothetical protein TNCV_2660161 [Trichonephila clavipes]
MQKGRYSTSTLLDNVWCSRRRRAFSWQLDRKSLDLEFCPALFTVMQMISGSLPMHLVSRAASREVRSLKCAQRRHRFGPSCSEVKRRQV